MCRSQEAASYTAHLRIGNHFMPGDPCACLKRTSPCHVQYRGYNFPVNTLRGWPRVAHPIVTWAPRPLFEIAANATINHPVGEGLLEIVARRAQRGLPPIPVHYVTPLFCDSDTYKVRNPIYFLNTRNESSDWGCWNRTHSCHVGNVR